MLRLVHVRARRCVGLKRRINSAPRKLMRFSTVWPYSASTVDGSPSKSKGKPLSYSAPPAIQNVGQLGIASARERYCAGPGNPEYGPSTEKRQRWRWREEETACDWEPGIADDVGITPKAEKWCQSGSSNCPSAPYRIAFRNAIGKLMVVLSI